MHRIDPPQEPLGPHFLVPTPQCRFRCGRLVVCPVFLIVVPRAVMIAAIKAHFTEAAVDLGDRLVGVHHWAGNRLKVETVPEEDATHIRLEV